MKLKTNLHFHTADDPKDVISYSFEEGIDKAVELGIEVIALTCHGFFAWREEYEDYAKKKGILLIPGIELQLNGPTPLVGRHTVVLNCEKDIEKVRTLDELREYKKVHPEIFILAPHPYYPNPLEVTSLKSSLEEYIDLFDAIELSWFYSWLVDGNRKAERIAKKHQKPFIATSDTHFFDHLGKNYAIVEAKEKSILAVLQAIKDGNFYNVAPPKKFFREMLWGYLIKREIKNKLFFRKKQ